MDVKSKSKSPKKSFSLHKKVSKKVALKTPLTKNEQKKNSASPKKKTMKMKSDSLGRSKKDHLFPVVGIGASAGGLEAFKRFFIAMPENPGIAFILIQHLDPTHQSFMVELLSRFTNMKVVQIERNLMVQPNHIYMIAPNSEIFFRDNELILSKPKQKRGWRTPIDNFFLSLAEDKRELAIGIILSGTGSDGTLGLKAIKSYGGMAMVQSPSTSQYDGMPASAIETGVIDYVLPIEEMPDALSKYVKNYHGKNVVLHTYQKKLPKDLNNIFSTLQLQTSHNFRFYKKNTIMRRITRRMSLKHIEKMSDYVDILRESPTETMELFNDLLINVTSFFREPESWNALQNTAIRSLVEEKKPNESIRVWVPGCASGEEAYSIGMLLLEKLQTNNKKRDIQIFATDIDEKALNIARSGKYSIEIVNAITPQHRAQQFFEKTDKYYLISRKLRDIVVFSTQNLISDPPFSKVDLISCRNLLIYLDLSIQKKIIPLFHYALRDRGFLYLGNSESIGQFEDSFETISKQSRIYRRKNYSLDSKFEFPLIPTRRTEIKLMHTDFQEKEPVINLAKLVQQELIQEYAPASVLINKAHKILYNFGNTVEYFKYPTGTPTIDLLSVVREGLLVHLRPAFYKALRDNTVVTIANAWVKRNSIDYPVKILIKPIPLKEKKETLLLVSFFESSLKEIPSFNPTDVQPEEESYVKHLEYELKRAKDELQDTTEGMENSNEELKASNEEIMSMNEELQSSNEELETSKEELQSLNEELNTVNNQLQEKIEAVQKAHNDLTNLVNSSSIATIFLDSSMQIRYYTPAIKKIFNFVSSDIGRPIANFTAKLVDCSLEEIANKVLDNLIIHEQQVNANNGTVYKLRCVPYRTEDCRIGGVAITLFDISDIIKKEKNLKKSEKKFHGLYSSMLEGVAFHELVYDKSKNIVDYRITDVNPAYEKILGLSPLKNTGCLASKWYGIKKAPYLETYAKVAETGEPYSFNTYFAHFKKHLSISAFSLTKGTFITVISDITDKENKEKALQEKVTESQKMQKELVKRNELFEQAFSSIHIAIAQMDKDINFVNVNNRYLQYYGLSASSVIGKNYFLVHPADEDIRKVFDRVFATREPHYIFSKEKYRKHDKSESRLALKEEFDCQDWTLQPLKDNNSNITGLLLSIIDSSPNKNNPSTKKNNVDEKALSQM